MNDMAQAVVAKSDQLNADDLMGGPITVRVRDTRVSDSGEQRVSILYDGDNNKPWKPCKSMCRVLVSAWGPDSKKYIGKYITLFRDADVLWGGVKVGGIRISHMSDIGSDNTTPLTVTRGTKKAYLVKPLKPAGESQEIIDLRRGGELMAKKGVESFKKWWVDLGPEKQNKLGVPFKDAMKAIADAADKAAVPVDGAANGPNDQ